MAMTHVSICIATHRRPAGLERLLTSLVEQRGAPPFRVVVVDNDAARSGEAAANRFRDRLELSYLAEPVRGLSRVRNRATAAVQTDYLAFIDDDEWATPEWLAGLTRTAAAFNADVVIGTVKQVFEDGVAEFIRGCGLFDSPARVDGATLPWYATRCGNALVRREALPDPLAPFSTRFDLVGGEDVDLFKRMIDRGARVVAAANADVYESRPLHRANLRWVMRRAIRNGGTIADLQWSDIDRKTRVARLFSSVVEAVGQTAKVGGKWGRDRAAAGRHMVRACEEIGKILHVAGVRIEEYRTHS